MLPIKLIPLLKVHQTVPSRSLYRRRHSSRKIVHDITRLLSLCAFVLLLTNHSFAQNSVDFTIDFQRTPNGTQEFFPPADGGITCRDALGSLADIDLFSQDQTPKILELFEGLTPPILPLDYIPSRLPYRCQVVFAQSQNGETFVSAPVFVTDQDFQNNQIQDPTPPPEIFIYYPVDTPASLQVTDRLGTPITDTPFGIKLNLFDPNADETITPSFQKQGAIPQGGQVDLVNNFSYRYRLIPPPNAINPGNGTQNPNLAPGNVFTSPQSGRSFYLRQEFETVAVNQAAGSPPLSLQIAADEATATLDVVLYDSDGITPINGVVRLESNAEPSILDSFDLLLNGEISSSSALTLPVVAGREYKISVFPTQTQQQGLIDKLPPRPVVFSIPAGSAESFAIGFTLQEPNYLLTLNLSATNQLGAPVALTTFASLSCSAYNARKEKTSAQVNQGDTSLILPFSVKNLNKKEKWRVECIGVEATTGNSRRYAGSINYTTLRSQTGDTASVSLTDVGTYYALVAPTVILEQSTKLTFPDGGATIEFPAGALSAQTGTGTVEISTATEFISELETLPLTVWEITPKIGGSEVSNPEKDAELCIPLDQEDLDAIGATTEAVSIARYEEESETWIPLATAITTDENGNLFACASVDHFSILGTIIDVALALQQTTPSSLKLRMQNSNLATKRCVASWTAPETEFADMLTYTVRFKKFRATNKRKRCQNLTEEQFNTQTVAGSTRTFLRTKGSCCVEVLVEDSESSTVRKYKKPR
ncbi:MAG: hypothetical protein ACO3XO_00850 [Bdellovibrionota bacterium]